MAPKQGDKKRKSKDIANSPAKKSKATDKVRMEVEAAVRAADNPQGLVIGGDGSRGKSGAAKQTVEASSSASKKAKSKKSKNDRPSVDNDPIAFNDRFTSDQARQNYTKYILSKSVLVEKPLDVKKCDKVFIDSLKKRKWHKLITVPEDPINASIYREFYANFSVANLDDGVVEVRGIKVPFSAAAINKYYGLNGIEAKLDYSEMVDKVYLRRGDPLEDLRLAIDPNCQWKRKKKNGQRKMLLTSSWGSNWKVMCKFIQNRLAPKYNLTQFNISDLKLLYALHFNFEIDVGRCVFTQFKDN